MGAIYFSHDEDARNDPKLTKLRARYGMEGYGCFFAILEMFSSESGHALDYSDEQFEAIAYDLHSQMDFHDFVDRCIEIGLYQSDGKKFWSDAFLRRATEAEKKSVKRAEKAKNAATARWDRRRSKSESVSAENEPAVDEAWLRFVRTFEQNIGLIPHGGTQTGQLLESYYKQFGADVMCKAVEVTNLKQPDNPTRFLLAVLRNWAERGVKNVMDAVGATKDSDRKHGGRKPQENGQQPEREPAIRGDFY